MKVFNNIVIINSTYTSSPFDCRNADSIHQATKYSMSYTCRASEPGDTTDIAQHTIYGLNTGQICGIVIGSIIGGLILSYLVWLKVRKDRRKKATERTNPLQLSTIGGLPLYSVVPVHEEVAPPYKRNSSVHEGVHESVRGSPSVDGRDVEVMTQGEAVAVTEGR